MQHYLNDDAPYLSVELLRNIMASITPAQQYIRFCHTNKQVAARIAGETLLDPARQSFLKHFFQTAPHLSRVQIIDLIHDDHLPWAETDVLDTVNRWKQLHPNEEGGLDHHIHHRRRIAYLHINWIRTSSPTQVETGFHFQHLTKQYKQIFTAWQTHLITIHNQQVVMCDTTTLSSSSRSGLATRAFNFHAIPTNTQLPNIEVTCVFVHGDWLYAAYYNSIHKYDLNTFSFVAQIRPPLKSDFTMHKQVSDISIGSLGEETFLWITHADSVIMIWQDFINLPATLLQQHLPPIITHHHVGSTSSSSSSSSAAATTTTVENVGVVVQAWQNIAFIASQNTIHLCHAQRRRSMSRHIGTNTKIQALAIIYDDDTHSLQLYAGTETGDVQAFVMLPQQAWTVTASWTINSNCGPCHCLSVRCGQLLYGGQRGFAVFEAADDVEGRIVYQCMTFFSVCHITNTLAAVFARSNRNDVYLCWSAA